MKFFIAWGFPLKDEPSPKEDLDDYDPDNGDELFSWRLDEFLKLGFSEFTAFALAWKRVSPGEVREKYLNRGASHDEAARCVL